MGWRRGLTSCREGGGSAEPASPVALPRFAPIWQNRWVPFISALIVAAQVVMAPTPNGTSVPTYMIDSAELVRKFWSKSPTRCEEAIKQLAARYRLAGRHVLSIGGGGGIQEHYLLLDGAASATVVEPDPHGNLRRFFDVGPPGKLRYVVTKADGWHPDQPYDTLFVSGYDADELRRADLVRSNFPWPKRLDPFHPAVMRYADGLPDGGLLIAQVTSGGVDIRANPDFMPAVQRQLGEHGLKLIEAYRYSETVGLMLLVASKGNVTIDDSAKLTTFYGRAAFEPIVRAFPE